MLVLVRVVQLIREIIISIWLCFKEHSREVSLQAIRDPESENRREVLDSELRGRR